MCKTEKSLLRVSLLKMDIKKGILKKKKIAKKNKSWKGKINKRKQQSNSPRVEPWDFPIESTHIFILFNFKFKKHFHSIRLLSTFREY